jgi:hypothetical protein
MLHFSSGIVTNFNIFVKFLQLANKLAFHAGFFGILERLYFN